MLNDFIVYTKLCMALVLQEAAVAMIMAAMSDDIFSGIQVLVFSSNSISIDIHTIFFFFFIVVVKRN